MLRFVSSIALFLAFIACGPTPKVDAPLVDAGTVEPDAGTPTPACEGEGACSLSWDLPAPFPVPVDHHTTFVHATAEGAHLLVIGGVDADFSNVTETYAEVRRAAVGADGSLGEWEFLDPLPKSLAFHGLAHAKGRIYLVGGITQGPVLNRATFVGDFAVDGTLSWRRGVDVPASSLHPGVGAVRGRLYLVGGTDQTPKANVVSAPMGEDGLNGDWTEDVPLPAARSHAALVIHEDRLYLVGGFTTGNVPAEEIWSSTHDASGALTGWQVAGEISDAPWTHSAFVKGPWLYVVGGGEGGPGEEVYVDRVRRAPLRANGTLGEFEELTAPLPVARAHVHQTPTFNGRVYSVGGRLGKSLDSTDAVFVGTFVD